MNGMAAVIRIRARAVKGFSIYADKTRGCAERLPLCASPDAFHSILKIRKREVVPVNQGFLRFCESFAAARRRPNCTAAGRFPLVPANAGTQSGFPRAREASGAGPKWPTMTDSAKPIMRRVGLLVGFTRAPPIPRTISWGL